MNIVAAPSMPASAREPARRRRRAVLWGALVALLLVAQTLLVSLTAHYESMRAQEESDVVAGLAVAELKRDVGSTMQSLQALLWDDPSPAQWRHDAGELMRSRRGLMRLEWRDAKLQILDVVESPYRPTLFTQLPRSQNDVEAHAACASARRIAQPSFSRSYFAPRPDGLGLEVIDACIPWPPGRGNGVMVATFSLAGMLEAAAEPGHVRTHELSFVEGDGTRLARSGVPRGTSIYVATRVVDLPGATLQLRADSANGRPRLIPNLATALVLGLSIALFALVLLLLRDVRRRARAESALAEALAFRKAMEDSLITGLRARDLMGRITYVNPAFCTMVDFAADELFNTHHPPYWPPEHADEYGARQLVRHATDGVTPSREGFEAVFMRKNGERFPVMIYEAPLVDGHGEHTGWMSAVLDMSAQRRVEELSRQQQERLQATARLATVGEMASLLSHELNQPLAAIASYATGSLNLMEQSDAQTPDMLRQAVSRIAEQAERAGRVIKSVHDFVRQREQARESVRADQLIESVLPLVRLQARKSATRIDVEMPDPAPHVHADRTMVEQVLLNLTRNGIQAMDAMLPAERVLRMSVRQTHQRWVTFTVSDQGPGIPQDVARRLFTPFFTTRTEGMGLGLSLCRTVIEQHGGTLDFETRTLRDDLTHGGTEFRFTLPTQ